MTAPMTAMAEQQCVGIAKKHKGEGTPEEAKTLEELREELV